MRVLVVTNLWPSREHPARGGFVRDQVQALRAMDGVDIELFTFGLGWRAYAGAARELRGRYAPGDFDLVHAHYGLCGWSALALRGDAPLVVTFHGTDLAHPVVGPMSRVLARRIALAAPVSASLAREGLAGAGMARAGRPRGRRTIAVLPTGVNLDRFQPVDRGEARRRLGLDPDRPLLLFPADPARPEKRHDRARRLAERAGVELLSYAGRHPDEIPDLVNSANAVLATSEREGFGLAPLEALACDVPVLATDVGVAPLVLRNLPGTLCASFELDRWLTALRLHLEDPDPRVEGRSRAALFDRNRFADRVFRAYQELLRAPL